MEASGASPNLLHTSQVAECIGKSRQYIINILGRYDELRPNKNVVGDYVWTPEQIKALKEHIAAGRTGIHRRKPA